MDESTVALADEGEQLVGLLRNHVPALDGIRGSAIVLLLMHQLLLPDRPWHKELEAVELLLQLGWVGVQLFFVLSGFLITGILLETRGRQGYYKAFYMRRVLRIFPLYYLMLITVAFILPRLTAVPPSLLAEPSRLTLNWVYLSNWTTNNPDVLGSTWSLAVEEQFYFIWPLIVAVTSSRTLLRLCGVLAVLSLGFRIVARIAGMNHELLYQLTPARMDALVLGSAVAVILRDPRLTTWLVPRVRKLLVATLVPLAALVIITKGLPRENLLTQTAGYSLLAVAAALLVALVAIESAKGGGRLSRFFAWRPLREVGKYSYAIYILQLPVHLWLTRVILVDQLAWKRDREWAVEQPLYMIGTTLLLFVLARISYTVIEEPFLKLKKFFQASRASPRA